MFQREFAHRLLAGPGDALYCRLSVNTQLLCKTTHLLKVSRNNFRPPPKVESDVVSLQPKQPQPVMNFVEWDGLLRICFSRKNKTLGALFRQSGTVSMLRENYKTWLALHPPASGGVTPLPEADVFKESMIAILEGLGMVEKRSQKLSIDDFLSILVAFNTQNIHFA